MRRISIFLSALMLAVLVLGIGGTAQAPERPVVLKIQLRNEAITPVTARFITRAIRQAEEQRAAALVIMLDTPGGLADSTREVVGAILQSECQ